MYDLESITDPSFLKNMKIKELKSLANDIRQFLIENVSETGGHLSSNLGIVEITIALYYVFDPKKDKILFDVGHQSYVHKILTGRAKDFKTLRQFGGISGYISRQESEYDIWESGHSSTSISAMAGMLSCLGKDDFCISLIGDSSIVNGVAQEAINYIGDLEDKRAIIVLNDNKMGISKSVGAFTGIFTKMRGIGVSRAIKGFFIKVLPGPINRLCHKIKRAIKGFIQHDNIFEDLGYDYYGPYNGNNLKLLIKLFEKIKKHPDQPIVIHLNTKKGLGYEFSEADDKGNFHGVPPFDIKTGKPKVIDETKTNYSKVVADYLVNKRKVEEFKVITPAMKSGAKLEEFSNLYPDDFIDVGIAEEHATVMGAGSLLLNKRAVLLMYSTFSQRAYDYLLNDVCRQNLKLIVGIDRAGIVGEDGVTHQGIYDVSMFSMMPNVVILEGRSFEETIGLFNLAFTLDKPVVTRYPRLSDTKRELDYNYVAKMNWETILDGNDINILGYGPDILRIKNICIENNISANVVDSRIIKPLDYDTLDNVFSNNKPILVVEQVVSSGTLYDKVLEYKEEKAYTSKVYKHSFDSDTLIPHGSIKDVYEAYGFSDNKLLLKIREILEK